MVLLASELCVRLLFECACLIYRSTLLNIDCTHIIRVTMRCEILGCGSGASVSRAARAAGLRRCREHMPSRRCARRGCNTAPTVGRPGNTIPTHCAAHALRGAVSIVARPCGVIGCEFASTYGPPGGRATHCRVHAPPGAVAHQTSIVRCAILRCGIEPKFTASGASGAPVAYCRKHVPRGAASHAARAASLAIVRADRATANGVRYCGSAQCRNFARFGLPGEPATRCRKHALHSHVDPGFDIVLADD